MVDINKFFEDWASCPVSKDYHSFEGLNLILKSKDFIKGQKFEIKGRLSSQAIFGKNVFIGENTVIDPFVVIEDNVIIGKNCEVRSCALIRSGTIVGDDCVIGHGSEVKNSIIFNEAKVASLVFVGDSVIGKGARLGSGTIIGNRRFDQKEVFWLYEEGKIPTGLDKLGSFIGDYTRLGAGVITSPGVMIGKYCWIPGNAVISTYIPPNKFLKMKVEYELTDNKTQLKLSRTDNEGNV